MKKLLQSLSCSLLLFAASCGKNSSGGTSGGSPSAPAPTSDIATVDPRALQTLSQVAWTAIVIMMTFVLLFGVFSLAITARNLAAAKTPDQRSQAMSGLWGAIISIVMASAVPIVFLLIVQLINMVS